MNGWMNEWMLWLAILVQVAVFVAPVASVLEVIQSVYQHTIMSAADIQTQRKEQPRPHGVYYYGM